MERATVAIYDERGEEWAAKRKPWRRPDAVAFGRAVRRRGVRLDAGAGAGRYTNELGRPVVALDASRTMLRQVATTAPHAWPVLADLESLPLRRGSVAGVWANMSYLHVPRTRLPLALWDLHRACEVGAVVDVQVLHGDHEGDGLPDDDMGNRFFAAWREQSLHDVLTGAGFAVEGVTVDGDVVRARATRARSLADTVGDGMRLLVCGLNPSLYAADAGVGFARATNRFWSAALAARVVSRARDARHALVEDGVGMTDLCKRATVASSELSAEEYRAGATRVERLVRWLQPGAVVFVGLEGYRRAVDRGAVAGEQAAGFGGRPAYVMPSTSGRVPGAVESYADQLRAAAAAGKRRRRR